MFMDKSVLDEQHASYAGMYDGTLMDEVVRNFVETRDRVLAIGTLMTDFNSGAFTSRLDPEKTINIGHHRTRVGGKTYQSVEMGDVLAALAKRLPKRWRIYLDRKVVHFAYFYVLWVTIQFGFKASGFAAKSSWSHAGYLYLESSSSRSARCGSSICCRSSSW